MREKKQAAPSALDADAPDVTEASGPNPWELIYEEFSAAPGWKRTTKRLEVRGGWLYQTETQQRSADGTWALSQALAFVHA